MSVRSPTLRVVWRQCFAQPTRPGSQTNSSSAWRYFNSSAPHSAKGVRRTVDSPWTAGHISGGNKDPRALAKLEAKVLHKGEMVLFQAPSHRTYKLTAYGLAGFCFAYSLYNSNEVFRDPLVPRPYWQKALFGGICVVMSVMGTVFIARTGSLVKSIKAVKSNNQMRVLFTVQSMAPFKKPYKVEVNPGEIFFKRQITVSAEAAQRFEMEKVRLGRGIQEEIKFFKSPAKKLSYMGWQIFQSLRQVFTNEDFIVVQVAGRKTQFRVDSNGYVSDELLNFGRIVNMKPPLQR